jgi:hypothetical protein
MNLRTKYSLKFFLLIATVVTVFLGYSQIRRKKVLEVCDGLKKDGYVFDTPNEFLDKVLWQRKPTVARYMNGGFVHMVQLESLVGMRRVEDRPEEAERLNRLGVLEVDLNSTSDWCNNW